MLFGFYHRNDKTREVISRTISTSRLQAAKHFAEHKKLPLKEFLKLFGIKKTI
jgi:hypothetical protein